MGVLVWMIMLTVDRASTRCQYNSLPATEENFEGWTNVFRAFFNTVILHFWWFQAWQVAVLHQVSLCNSTNHHFVLLQLSSNTSSQAHSNQVLAKKSGHSRPWVQYYLKCEWPSNQGHVGENLPLCTSLQGTALCPGYIAPNEWEQDQKC